MQVLRVVSLQLLPRPTLTNAVTSCPEPPSINDLRTCGVVINTDNR
jgi:hypothetical protein